MIKFLNIDSKKLSIILSLVVLLLIFFSFKTEKDFQRFEIEGNAQGTTYKIIYYAKEAKILKSQVDCILLEIDSSMSIYKEYSLINKFNNNAKGVLMDTHFKKVIEKSTVIAKKTNGDFDITVYPLINLWGFGLQKDKFLPDSMMIKSTLLNVGFKYLQIKSDSLIKKNPQVKIDLNGIAQGYSVDLIASFLQKNKVNNFVVELGGELRINGKKENNKKFMIGIEGVKDQDFLPITKYIEIEKGAVTTSGNYRKFYKSEGKIISHLINPHTGYSVNNELISVTVYAKNAITADGFDNAFMVMGLKKALKFIEQNKSIQAYFIFKDKKGNIKDTCSLGFPNIKSIKN